MSIVRAAKDSAAFGSRYGDRSCSSRGRKPAKAYGKDETRPAIVTDLVKRGTSAGPFTLVPRHAGVKRARQLTWLGGLF